MEQPTQLVVRPLSQDVQDDRLRMVFGLTCDDPLPLLNEETGRQYRDYLKAHLAFPFEAGYFCQLTNYSCGTRHVTVIGLSEPSPMDLAYGVRCDVCFGQKTEQVPLANLELHEGDPNYGYVEDFRHWLEDVHEDACYTDENGEEVHWDDEEDPDEYREDDEAGDDDWDDEAGDDEDWDDEDFDNGDDEGDEEEDTEDFGPRLADNLDDGSLGPQPIRNKLPPVGRNDACPCGSGKKFKKCCLRKSTTAEDDL
jgi:hypothetical protein